MTTIGEKPDVDLGAWPVSWRKKETVYKGGESTPLSYSYIVF